MSDQAGSTFHDLLTRAQQGNAYWTERAILDFTEDLSRTMQEHNVSRAELARRIGSSQAYVTKILGGNANFTLASMTKLARALDCEVRVHMAREASLTRWIDRIPGEESDVGRRVPSGHSSLEVPPATPGTRVVTSHESYDEVHLEQACLRAAI